MKFLNVFIILMLFSTACASSAHVLSNQAESKVTILTPVVRTYSLDNESWQEGPISFENTSRSNVTIYIRMENHAARHFDMNIYHYFTHNADLFTTHRDFNYLRYGLYNDEAYDMESMWTGEWDKEKIDNQTVSFRWKAQTYVNAIEPQTIRYEKIELNFSHGASPSVLPDIYQYDSTIYLANTHLNGGTS